MINVKSVLLSIGLAAAAALPASAITFTLDGKNGSYTQSLTAGNYVVDIAKDAWSAWSSGGRWLNAYFVQDAKRTRRINDGTQYATVQEAVDASQAYTFTLDTDQDVSFYIRDFGDVSNNRGQLTLDLSKLEMAAVPVPAAGLLLLSGLMAPLAFRRRLKKA